MLTEPLPIETAVGTLWGRDAIYLDDTSYSYRTRVLTLRGEFNAHLCSKPPNGDWVKYEITIEGVDCFKVIELDCWRAYGYGSLLEMPRSTWIDELNAIASPDESHRRRWPRIGNAFKHFVVQTYDHVFEVIAGSLRVDLGEVREG